MSKELVLWNVGTGVTAYYTLRRSTDRFFYKSGGTFEAQTPANWTSYAFGTAATDATTGDFEADFPTLNTVAGFYEVSYYQRLTGTPATTDTRLGYDTVAWDGTQIVDGLKLTAPMKKNTAFANFTFTMVSSVDHLSPYSSGVSGLVSLDGGAPVALSAAPTLVSATEGMYRVSFSAGDLNGTSVVVIFSGSGADKRRFEFLLQP